MLPTTLDALKSILRADPSITPTDRKRLTLLARNHGEEPERKKPAQPDQPRILRRKEVASRLGRSCRFVDKLATECVLVKIKLPGRKRACGFRSVDVQRLLEGDIS